MDYRTMFDKRRLENDKIAEDFIFKMLRLFADIISQRSPELYNLMSSKKIMDASIFEYHEEYSPFISEKDFYDIIIDVEQKCGRRVPAIIRNLITQSIDDKSIMSKKHRYVKGWTCDESGKYTISTVLGDFSYWSAIEHTQFEEILKIIKISNPEQQCFTVAYRTIKQMEGFINKDSDCIKSCAATGTLLGQVSGQKIYHSWIQMGDENDGEVLDLPKKIIMPVGDYYRLFVDFSNSVIRTSYEQITNLPEEINRLQSLIYGYMEEEYRNELYNKRRDLQFEGQGGLGIYDPIFGREM